MHLLMAAKNWGSSKRRNITRLNTSLQMLDTVKLEIICVFFFQAEDGIRDYKVTGVQTCALPILVVGIQDLGGAGLSCATSELASAGDGGMHVFLERVPLRATGMPPAEILSSESQERMCAVVRPSDVDDFLAVCAKWDVTATDIGEVTAGDRLVITWHGDVVVDVPPRTVAHQGPVYERPVERPATQDALRANVPDVLLRPSTSDELR